MMLFPEDPKLRPQLLDALATQLRSERLVSVVEKSKGDAFARSALLDAKEVDELLFRMESAAVSRISASRGGAFAPHFLGELSDRVVTITDFLTLPSPNSALVEPEKLQGDLEIAALNLLFTRDGVDVVRVPIGLPVWENKDMTIQARPGWVEFHKSR